MRKVFYFALVFLIGITASVNAQVNIGSQKDAHSGALLELDASLVKKGLLLPRIAIADVNAWGLAGDPVAGMVVFNTGDNKVYVWNGEKWAQMGEGQTTPVVVAVTGVSVTPTPVNLTTIGATEQLVATVEPGNATNQTVSWSSDNTSVATVSSTGLVTAVANGTATITVTTEDGGKEATVSITVSASIAVTGVNVSPTSKTLTSISATQQLTATVSPENATNKNVSWSSNNTSVATVDDSGLVTAVANGTATITATTEDGGKTVTSTITVDISTVATSVEVLPKSTNLTKFGATVQLTATVLPSGAPQAVVWSTNKPTVATVTQDGLVTAISEGMAVIIATADGGIESPKVGITVNPILTDCPGYRAVGGEYTTAQTGNLKIPEHTTFETLLSAAWGFESTGKDLCFYKKDGTDSAAKRTDDCSSGNFVDTEDRIVRWRLPNVAELGAIQSVYSSLDSQPTSATGTTNLQDGVFSSYWSSTSYDGYEWIRWNFKESYTTKSLSSNVGGYLRCVCSMESTTPTGVAVTGVSVTPEARTLTTIGATEQLTATVAPENATNKNVSWSSDNTSVATVSASGLVTAKANGTATITVTTEDGGETATSIIVVNTPVACPGYLAVGGEYKTTQTGYLAIPDGTSFDELLSAWGFYATGKNLCFYKTDGNSGNVATGKDAENNCTNGNYVDAVDRDVSWRLPNVAELGAIQSVYRDLSTQPTSTAGTAGMKNYIYWSSTRWNFDVSVRWRFNYNNTAYYHMGQENGTYVRCVRSLNN